MNLLYLQKQTLQFGSSIKRCEYLSYFIFISLFIMGWQQKPKKFKYNFRGSLLIFSKKQA